MVLDEDGIPHSFCISKSNVLHITRAKLLLEHNEIVAERVKEWVSEIVNADRSDTAIVS